MVKTQGSIQNRSGEIGLILAMGLGAIFGVVMLTHQAMTQLSVRQVEKKLDFLEGSYAGEIGAISTYENYRTAPTLGTKPSLTFNLASATRRLASDNLGSKITNINGTNNFCGKATLINGSSREICISARPPVLTLQANGTSGSITIPFNSAALLSWTSTANGGPVTNCSLVRASNSSVVSTELSQIYPPGLSTGNLSAAETYNLTCNGPGGVATASVMVKVGPMASISASPSSVDYASNSTLSWTSQNATSCTVNPGGFSGTSGTRTVGPLFSTTSYTLTCSGSGLNATSTATVTVKNNCYSCCMQSCSYISLIPARQTLCSMFCGGAFTPPICAPPLYTCGCSCD